MINAYQEQIFYHYVLTNHVFLKNTLPEFFKNKTLSELYKVAREHTVTYGSSPSKEQVIELLRVKGLSEEIKDDVVTALYNQKVLLNNYDKEWLDDNIGAWITVRNVEDQFRKGMTYLKTTQVTAENAQEVAENIKHMMTTGMSVDMDFNMSSDFFDPTAHLQERLARTPTGYPYIDKCLKGGFWKGALIAFLSGPKAGKSMWLQNLATMSTMNGYNTAYITLELQEELVNMRFGANLLNVKLDEYEEFAKDQDLLKKKLGNLKQESLKPLGALRVKEFPSSTASVNDIRAHLKKEQEMLGIKFDNVFIDYINLMRNWRNPNTENTYMKIKQISEDLRAMAMEEGWCVITVTQTNRAGWESSDLNIGDVSESAALIHTVDALFGIITNPLMKAAGEYLLKYLADRVSGMENTRKRFEINWAFARINEDRNSPIEDMDQIYNQTANMRAVKDRSTVQMGASGNAPELNQDKANNINVQESLFDLSQFSSSQ